MSLLVMVSMKDALVVTQKPSDTKAKIIVIIWPSSHG